MLPLSLQPQNFLYSLLREVVAAFGVECSPKASAVACLIPFVKQMFFMFLLMRHFPQTLPLCLSVFPAELFQPTNVLFSFFSSSNVSTMQIGPSFSLSPQHHCNWVSTREFLFYFTKLTAPILRQGQHRKNPKLKLLLL